MEPFYQALHYAVTGDPRVFGHHAGLTQHGYHMATAMASAQAASATAPPIHGSRSSCSASPAIGSSSAKPPPLSNFPENNSRNTATVPPMPHHTGYHAKNRGEPSSSYHSLASSAANGGGARSALFHNSLTPSTTTSSSAAATHANSGFAEALRQLAKQVGNDPISERNPFMTIGGSNRENERECVASKFNTKNTCSSLLVSESLMYPNGTTSSSRVTSGAASHPPIVTIAPSQRRTSNHTALAGSEHGFQPYLRGSVPGTTVGSSALSVASSSSTSSSTSANWSEHMMLAQLYNGLMSNGAAEGAFYPPVSGGNTVAGAAAAAAANYQAQQLAAMASAGGGGYPLGGGGEMAAALWYQRLIQQATLAAAGVSDVQAGASPSSSTWHRAATSQQHQQAAASAAAVVQMEMMQQYMLALQQHHQQQSAAAAVMQGLMMQQQNQGPSPASSLLGGCGTSAATALLAAATGGGRSGVELRRQSAQQGGKKSSGAKNVTLVDEAVVLDLSQNASINKTKQTFTCPAAKVKLYRPFEPSPPPPPQQEPLPLNSTVPPFAPLNAPSFSKNSKRLRLDSLLTRQHLHSPNTTSIDELKCTRNHLLNKQTKTLPSLRDSIIGPDDAGADGCSSVQLHNEFLIDPPNALSDALCRGHDFAEKKRFMRSMTLQPLSRQAKRETDARRRKVDAFVKRIRLQALLHSFSPDQLLEPSSTMQSESTQDLDAEKSFNARRFHASILKMSSWCDKKAVSVSVDNDVYLNSTLCTVDVM